MRSIFVLVVFFLSAWGAADAANNYDYLKFVVQWPPMFCRLNPGKCIQSPPTNRFTVHGLWPSNYSTTPGQDCVGTQFSVAEMLSPANKGLRSNLVQAWPQLKARSSNMDFWEYEYNKHGTCSENNLNQTEYFKKAYSMWSNYNVYQLFSAAQIYPGNQYPLTDFQQAIQRVTSYQPVLRCENMQVGGNNHWVLNEVIICFDALGNNLARCGGGTSCQGLNALWLR